VIYGDGSKVRDYVYIDDVVDANVAALDKGHKEVFNIASGVPTTDDQVFAIVRERLGRPTLCPRYLPRRPGEIEQIYLDISKAKRLLAWEPKVPFDLAASRTVAFFQHVPQTLSQAV